VVDALKAAAARDGPFALAMDAVGDSPADLYRRSHEFLAPDGRFVQMGGSITVKSVCSLLGRVATPGFLGGGKRKFEYCIVKPTRAMLGDMGALMAEGKVKAAVERVYAFEEAPQAFERLKTGKVAGKLVIKVSEA